MWDIISKKLLNSDAILRDEHGTLALEHKMKTIIGNLVADEELSAEFYDDYIAFDYYINRDHYYHQVPAEPAIQPFYSLPSQPDHQHQYVSDVLTRDTVNSWKPGDRVFLSAGTGKGKNTFIKEILLKYSSGEKIVIFENRESLLSQQIFDMVKSIDPDALRYQDLSKENMVIFGSKRNIMLISYQKAALKCLLDDREFLQFCSTTKYLVFDEIHYILDDSRFNKGINCFVKYFLQLNSFPQSTKLFLSGSMEEVFVYLQEMHPLKNGYRNMTNAQVDRTSVIGWILENYVNRCPNHMLHMPTDYSYIDPCVYQEPEDLIEKINKSVPEEKWLVFVESKEDGQLLLEKLLDNKDLNKEKVNFLHADNKNSRENKEVYRDLICNEKFDCRILIATTVIYNGINIKDRKLRHIVLPFTTVPITKQLIGRKRVQKGERISVYFPVVTESKVSKRFRKCLQDYYEIIKIKNNPLVENLIQLNGLSQGGISDYACFTAAMMYDKNNNLYTAFAADFNLPAIQKLHFDTVYYLFLLKKLKCGCENSYTEVMLHHLGVFDNLQIESIIKMSADEIRQQLQKEVETYLEQFVDHPIEEATDENSKYLSIGEFCAKMNDFSMRLDGDAISSHWQDHTRFISQKEFDDFLHKLNLKFEIKIKKTRGVDIKTLSVIRIS